MRSFQPANILHHEQSSIDRLASALLKKINLIGDSARKPDIV